VSTRRTPGTRPYQWEWLGLAAGLGMLTMLTFLALARRESIIVALPLTLRLPALDLLVIALPLLPAFAIRAVERGARPPRAATSQTLSTPGALLIARRV